jgi:hypothetical protein
LATDYRIECYSTEGVTEELLRTALDIAALDNEHYTIEISDYEKIYFRDHSSIEISRVAFAKLVEVALLNNDAIVISKLLGDK